MNAKRCFFLFRYVHLLSNWATSTKIRKRRRRKKWKKEKKQEISFVKLNLAKKSLILIGFCVLWLMSMTFQCLDIFFYVLLYFFVSHIEILTLKIKKRKETVMSNQSNAESRLNPAASEFVPNFSSSFQTTSPAAPQQPPPQVAYQHPNKQYHNNNNNYQHNNNHYNNSNNYHQQQQNNGHYRNNKNHYNANPNDVDPIEIEARVKLASFVFLHFYAGVLA